MDMRNIVIGFIVVAVLVVAFIAMSCSRQQNATATAQEGQEVTLADLSEGEKKVSCLIHEVHGDAIVAEKFVKSGGSVEAELEFDTSKSKIQNLKVNLTNLARKQREDGLSDAALKASLQF